MTKWDNCNYILIRLITGKYSKITAYRQRNKGLKNNFKYFFFISVAHVSVVA